MGRVREMHNRIVNVVVLVAIMVAGCGPSAPIKPEEPVYVRPVVLPELGGDELVKAISLIKENNFRQAEVNLEEIVKVRPDIPEAHFNLGWVKHQLGRYADAIVALQGGLALRPTEIRAHRLIGLCQRELGQFREAELTYSAALTMAPDDPGLHLNIGILYELYLRQPGKALEHYRLYQGLRAEPDVKVEGWIKVLERSAKG